MLTVANCENFQPLPVSYESQVIFYLTQTLLTNNYPWLFVAVYI